VEVITRALHQILRVGVRPAQLVRYIDLFPNVGETAGANDGPAQQPTADPYLHALTLAEAITAAVRSLGDGPVGLAAQALFGTTVEARGRLLKDRRRMAAEELGIVVSTFRTYYEDALVADVALALWESADMR
jgi:hypothetical protein